MQSKNLGLKFAFVALLVALSLYSIWAKELRLGIDLKGGHILTFEILATGGKTPGLVERVIARLKKRIDPNGTRSLEWRKVGPTRFQVRMPLGTDESRRAKQIYLETLRELQEDNIRRSEIRQVVSLGAQARADAIERIAGGDAERIAALQKVARTHDAEVRAGGALEKLKRSGRATAETIKKARADLDDARSEHNTAFGDLLKFNVNTEYLGQVLRLYVSDREAKVLPRDELKERRDKYAEQLEQFRGRYPARRAEIDMVVSGYTDWTEKRTGLDDPADLRRMVAKAGVLEFRIAPTLPLPGMTDEKTLALTEQQYETYLEQLTEHGPLVGRSRIDDFQWFGLHGKGENLPTNVVVGEYAGKKYILLYNRDGYTMLRNSARKAWSLSARPGRDTMGRPAVHFSLDARGAKLMGLLTGAHQGHFMAIMLDNEAYSAPVINEPIYANGIITGEFTTKEVGELVRILEAGALAGQVNETPVSVKTVAPGIGKDNRDAGFQAAIWGLIGVAVFMAAYYLLPGLIANFALLLNLVLLLGAMSFIEAVFTLPGIAGIILTIGIAVDANVLIFERLREEQKKTQSLRIAFRNAYSSAARAIFDGNITTLLTCVILGWVGSEEIVGFAITLGLGVMFSLFTSLLVTRWIFQLLLEWGWIKNRVRMAAFIGTPKINWLGKRKIFWVVSVLLVAAGIGSLASQGKDVLGIEFSSGTQAVFTFKPGRMVSDTNGEAVMPQRRQIEDALKGEALRLAEDTDNAEKAKILKKLLETIKVETLLNPDKATEYLDKFDTDGNKYIDMAEWTAGKGSRDFFAAIDADGDGKVTREGLATSLPERSYQVSTTVADVDLLREVIEGAFVAALDVRTSVEYKLCESGPVPGLNVELKSTDKGLTHISAGLAESVAPEMRAKFIDFIGGAMFIVQNVSPALTEADLAGRIQTMRLQSDFADYQFNRTAVVGLKADPVSEGFSTLAVLVLNPNADYVGRPEEWKGFAAGELNLMTESLARAESLEAVSKFDPAIAGRASQLAIIAFVLSWLAIVMYLWLRFGSARWGLAAVVCLVHDVVIAVGLVALAAFIHDNVIGRFLLVQPFKIDMAVVAAFLTIIGYSVNDTIVVFDRIRENRGKLASVDEPIINRSINQTISRTLLTTTTTLIAVVVMYIWGGAGIHAFTYALLVGIIVGTYSSIAIASPLLLGIKKALAGRAASKSPYAAK